MIILGATSKVTMLRANDRWTERLTVPGRDHFGRYIPGNILRVTDSVNVRWRNDLTVQCADCFPWHCWKSRKIRPERSESIDSKASMAIQGGWTSRRTHQCCDSASLVSVTLSFSSSVVETCLKMGVSWGDANDSNSTTATVCLRRNTWMTGTVFFPFSTPLQLAPILSKI